mgnify:CR=1 FL=1
MNIKKILNIRNFVTTFLILFLCIFVLASCDKKEKPEEKVYLPEVKVIKVEPGLNQEFTVTGEVFAQKVNKITAEQRAKVESIFVKEGDSINRGARLVSLSSLTVNSTLNTAGRTLQNARLNLDGTRLTSEQSVKAAQITLSTAMTNLENVLLQNKTLKKQAEETLRSSKITLDLTVSSATTTLNNAVTDKLTVVKNAFDASNKILGITDFYKYAEVNSNFRQYLGVAKLNSKLNAEKSLKEVQDLLSNYSESYENILKLSTQTEDALQKLLIALNNSVNNVNYTKASIAADITIVNAQIGYVKAAISALKTAKVALDSAEKKSSDGKSQTELNAQATYNATITQLKTNEESSRRSVESAKNALESAKRSAQLSQISAKTSVDSAYGSYDQARINKNKLIIKANFAGKVSEIHVKIGEEISAGVNIITIKDDSKLKLVAYLSSSDVKKISVGDSVIINKNDELATIASIAPSADPVTKKYKIEISHSNSNLKPGELVQITFRTGKIMNLNKIYIPLAALHIMPEEIFVWKLKGNTTVKAKVTTSSITGNYVEILSGLKFYDEIISQGGRLIKEEGVEVKVQNRPKPKIPTVLNE